VLDPLGVGAVTVIERPDAALPGLMETEYWQEFEKSSAPAEHAVAVQPVGAISVNPVIAYWLLAGLLSVKAIVLPGPPLMGEPTVIATAGGLAFAATTGATTGTKMRNPEKKRRDRIVPELNFVTYDLEIVFISCFQDGAF
jgi:hypothetical protein